MKKLPTKTTIIKGFTFEEIAAKKKEELTIKAEALKENAISYRQC